MQSVMLRLCVISFLWLSLILLVLGTSPTDGQEDSIVIVTVKQAPESGEQMLSDSIDKTTPLPQNLLDEIEDSFFDALSRDPSCNDEDCWAPPDSTIVSESDTSDGTCSSGTALGDPPESTDGKVAGDGSSSCKPPVDKHWGSDQNILRMRDKLREAGSVAGAKREQSKNDKTTGKAEKKPGIPKNRRPPVFLMPGLASTRLIAWKFKSCQHPLLSDIKVLDIAWLNINLVFQMGTWESSCLKDCLALGLNQTDTDDLDTGCKLRPDEGLDAISSLSPGGLGSELLVGGTNTVYAWLIQWLADNLGYDVTNVIGLPYDWRLSPDRMEARDGFLTLTRRRIEAAVKSNGEPGIFVAHSMGNVVFRYFLEWLRQEMREESYQQYLKRAERRAKKINLQHKQTAQSDTDVISSVLPGWMGGVVSGFDEWWNAYFASQDGTFNEEEARADAPHRHPQLWELAKLEGDGNWIDWLEEHIWTYVGLSAPLLGAINPLRAVISGENMGLPISDEVARGMEVTFGSTHSVNPVSSKSGFCDLWDSNEWDEEPSKSEKSPAHTQLACLDDIFTEVKDGGFGDDPWKDHPALKSLLKDRVDWDSDFPMIEIKQENCKQKGRQPNCTLNATTHISPRDSETGKVFDYFNSIFKEENRPMTIKREQMEEAFWNTKVPNILNHTWERPLIKHVIMAYGVDIPTEVGYSYKKKVSEPPPERKDEFDGVPNLDKVIIEEANGELLAEQMDITRSSLADLLKKKRRRREELAKSSLHHSGDGSVPYLSLSWAHTWLLHAARALRHKKDDAIAGNPLDDIKVSHRPKGAMEWVEGAKEPEPFEEKKREKEGDTGTNHPHGTRYKPEMHRFHNVGKSRTTGMMYTTTVIEAIGVEHKETTRNYDIQIGRAHV